MNRKLFLLAGLLLLMACQSSNTTGANAVGAPKVIENYLQAKVKADVNQMIALSCAAWESQAKVEASSFQSLKGEIEGMSCSVSSAEGSTAIVACQGKIKTTYNGESKERDLGQQQFKLAQEGGDWRMCGYK